MTFFTEKFIGPTFMLSHKPIVVDDFADHPELMREESLLVRYVRRPMSPGCSEVSLPSRYTPLLGKKFARLAEEKVLWDPGSGTYRKMFLKEVKRTGTAFMAHSDGSLNFIALLYLNLPSECQGGTAFYRHKATGLEGYHDPRAVLKALKKLKISFTDLQKMIWEDAQKPRRWERTRLVQMKYNRALIYNGWLFHSHVLDLRKFKNSSVRLTFSCFGSLLRQSRPEIIGK
jgi:hypothetical protein